jgi:hypothetical protein
VSTFCVRNIGRTIVRDGNAREDRADLIRDASVCHVADVYPLMEPILQRFVAVEGATGYRNPPALIELVQLAQ